MALIQGTLGGISGGVSQQPDILRYPGQCTAQDNMILDLVKGLRRRGAFEVVALLDASIVDDDIFTHWFVLEEMDYIAIFTATNVAVYDLTGQEYTVEDNGSYLPYLGTNFNSAYLSSVQIGEYNMISTQEVSPAMDPAIEETGDEYVTFQVKDGMIWGIHIEIHSNAELLSLFSAPAGDVIDGTQIAHTSSLWAVSTLMQFLKPKVEPEGWIVTQDDSCMLLHRPFAAITAKYPASSFRIGDSVGDSVVSCVISEVQTLDDLPPAASNHQWVNVKGKESSSLDDFYMEYTTKDGTLYTEGTWKECNNKKEAAYLDPLTMPHALIRTADGDFHFTPLDGSTKGGSVVDTWAKREVGDDDSNPVPSFTGWAIYDMAVVQQRLVIVTGDFINMSCTAKEFNFWNQSALTVTDTDTIELTTPGEQAAKLYSALEHEQNLLVLGDKRQFAIPLKSALTKANAALVPTTAYDVDRGCKPVVCAGGMFFTFSDGLRSGVREYRTGSVATIHVADEVTSHLGDYIPPYVRSLASDRQEGVILTTHKNSSDIYRYHFLYQDGMRIVHSWSRMSMPFIHPLSITSIGGHFYILGQGANGVCIYRLDKQSTYHIDYQVSATVVDGVADFSSWVFKDIAMTEDIIAVMHTGAYVGVQVQVEDFSGGTLTLHDAELFNGEIVTLGVKYQSLYSPTMPVPLDRNNKAMQLDRLMLNLLDVSVHKTGAFSVMIRAPFYSDTYQEYSGKIVGNNFVVGEVDVTDRVVRVSVGHPSTEVEVVFHTHAFTDLIIQAIEYKGTITKRGVRL